MGKCKNTNCNNETKGKNVYCSLTCRNVYVNKYLRDYSKNSVGLSEEKQYYESPKNCVRCNKQLRYEQRKGKYCGHECAASDSNLGRKHNIETCNKISVALIKNFKIKCKGCENEILKNEGVKFCSKECSRTFKRKNMTEFQKYKQECLFKFALSDYPGKFDFSLIEQHGWYKPTNRGNNLNGISRDHMYSVRDGFDSGIDAKLIAHPANCKLVPQRENSSKHKKSSISIEELKTRVENWDK